MNKNKAIAEESELKPEICNRCGSEISPIEPVDIAGLCNECVMFLDNFNS